MKPNKGRAWSRHPVLCALALCLTGLVQAKNECAPVTWSAGEFEGRSVSGTATSSFTGDGSTDVSSSLVTTPTSNSSIPVVTISHLIKGADVTVGEVNCRYTANTRNMDLNHCTCTALAIRYRITIEAFFTLNPGLHGDCRNIQADTDYCVRGCKKAHTSSCGSICPGTTGN